MRHSILTTAGLLLLTAGLAGGQTSPATEPPTLAALWTPAILQRVLAAPSAWRPVPVCSDRRAWEDVAVPLRARILAAGERALAEPFPPLPATQFLEFAREGNRSRFEAAMFARRAALHALVLAECARGDGRYVDAIVNATWAIAEESSWTVPAHQGAQRAGVGLPDVTEPVVDLFSAQTAHSLAWTVYLVGERLDSVSPLVRPRLVNEIRRRVLEPFHAREDYGWMGFGRRPGRPNNWNPWINSNVIASALLVESDQDRRIALVHKALRSLDRYLGPHPVDGSCDEGPNYWGRAAGSLFEALEILHSASSGALSVFDHPVIAEMGRFILRARVAGDWFVDVGDSSARVSLDGPLVFRYGRAVGDRALQALGAGGTTADTLALDDRSLGRTLFAIAGWPQMTAFPAVPSPYLRDVWLPSEDMQLMAARDRADTTDGLFVAAWAAHNDQSHNHNDVGNLIVFVNGDPVLVDVGRPTYTAKTFGARRYELWPMQSAFHNVPQVNGVMQGAGRRFAADRVRYVSTERAAELSMNLAPAYPPEAGIETWMRSVRLDRGQAIELHDAFELAAPSADIRTHLMTPCGVRESAPGRITLTCGRTATSATHEVVVRFDAAALRVSAEPVAMNDLTLERVWGPTLTRLTFAVRSPVERGAWTLTIAPVR